MKKTMLGLLFFASGTILAQDRINASGGDASGPGGEVAYTIGLVDYTASNSGSGSVSTGVQHVYIQAVGIDEWDLSYDITVFPNPAVERVIIKVPDNSLDFHYHLLDMNGKVIQSGLLAASKNHIMISSLESATYFLTVSSNGNTVRTFKLIKNQ